MESYGAHCVYVTDSGGRLVMNDVADRVRAYRDILDEGTEIGIHAHENLSLSVANSVVAVQNGVTRVDASLAVTAPVPATAPSRPSSPSPTSKSGSTAATCSPCRMPPTDIVRPLQDRPVRVDRETLTLGYAGVYSSFLRHAEAASERYGIDVRTLLLEAGRRRLVGGQEDMIVDIALTLAAQATKEAV